MLKIGKALQFSILGATLAISISGCSSMNSPLPSKQAMSQKSGSIELTYKFNDTINGDVSKDEVYDAMASLMSKKSRYKDKQEIWNGNFRDIHGKVISHEGNKLIVDYTNGDDNCHNCINGKSTTDVLFVLPTTVKEISKNNFIVKSSFPTQYTIKPFTDALGFEHNTLDKEAFLDNDAKRIFDSLKTNPVTITRKVKFTGEVNTKYPDKAVYANFKRIMGEFYDWRQWSTTSNEEITETEKKNTFNLVWNQESFPIHVEVYPYRDGSKVTYTSTLFYTIDSTGNTTISSNDMKKLREKIEKVVND